MPIYYQRAKSRAKARTMKARTGITKRRVSYKPKFTKVQYRSRSGISAAERQQAERTRLTRYFDRYTQKSPSYYTDYGFGERRKPYKKYQTNPVEEMRPECVELARNNRKRRVYSKQNTRILDR